MQFKAMAAAVTIVLIGSSAAAQETVSLSDAANREVWRGEATGAQAAFYLDRGDVSAGDSRRDLIVGAPGWNSNTGRVYVVFSGGLRTGQFALSSASETISGAAAGDRFGEATAAGYVTAREATTTPPLPTRDLVVAAPGANSNSGKVYMFLRGLTGGSITTADATLTITGAPAGARLGAALATGDLDGDGFRDIIIGAPGIGAVYVVHGGSSVSGTVDLSTPSSAFFKIQGSAADGVGQVLTAGDLLGHAVPNVSAGYDLAIGAPFEGGNTGAVYVVFARGSNTFPATMNLATDADARFGGIDAGDFAGKALQIAPIDKDRFSDLLIGAPQADGPGNGRPQAGEIYVIWGGLTVPSRSLAAADLTIYGADDNYQEGSVLAYGDVTRDGTADFVSLAAGASAAGDLHLFNGRSRTAWGSSIDLRFTFPDRRLIGDPARGTIQSASVVDLTGEAFDDIEAGYPGDIEGSLQINHSLGVLVTEAPLSRTINPDVLTTFSAGATASPDPVVQWQVSTDNGATWFNVAGATSNRLAMVAHASDNGKRFRAVFSNSVNSATTTVAFLTVRSVAQAARRADFDGDGASDLVVWRPSTGTWFPLTSGSGFASGNSVQWGNSSLGDKPFSGDIDGDGIMDPIVWRPGSGTWFWLTSGTNYAVANSGAKQWGNQSLGDVPMIGDMDGDGKADLVIWRASTGTWFWLTSSSGYDYNSARGIQWGNPNLGDIPLLGDFDGDRRQDLAVWRASTGTWFWLTSSTNYATSSARGVQWGNSSLGDIAMTGDTDGDGKSDLIIWRPGSGTWFWLKSSTNYTTQAGQQWGNQSAGDVPMIGDFDGDGRADLAVWRKPTGTWFWLTFASGYNPAASVSRQWGASTDTPMVK
jgi:hypothetical protein